MTFLDALGVVLGHITSPLIVAILMVLLTFAAIITPIVAFDQAAYGTEPWHVVAWIAAVPILLVAITMLVWISSFPSGHTWP